MKKLVYVRWRDAMKEEAESGGPAKPSLITLEEIGWLAAEKRGGDHACDGA